MLQYPHTHILQTSTWGELKSSFGWEVIRIIVEDAGAQILMQKLPFGFSWAYLPKGPVGKNFDKLWPVIDQICRQKRSVFLKIEPNIWDDQDANIPKGFVSSSQSIQPLRTIIVNLEGAEEEILARMKQKTRYNIRLAKRKEVEVHPTDDVDVFYKLIQLFTL